MAFSEIYINSIIFRNLFYFSKLLIVIRGHICFVWWTWWIRLTMYLLRYDIYWHFHFFNGFLQKNNSLHFATSKRKFNPKKWHQNTKSKMIRKFVSIFSCLFILQLCNHFGRNCNTQWTMGRRRFDESWCKLAPPFTWPSTRRRFQRWKWWCLPLSTGIHSG